MQDAELLRTRMNTYSQIHQYHQQLCGNGEGSTTFSNIDAPEDSPVLRYQPSSKLSYYEMGVFHKASPLAYGNQRYARQTYDQPFKPLPASYSLIGRAIGPNQVLDPRIRINASTSPAWPSLRDGDDDDTNENDPSGGQDETEDETKKTTAQQYAEEVQAQARKARRELSVLYAEFEREPFQRDVSGSSAQQDCASDESDPDDRHSLSPAATVTGRAALEPRVTAQHGGTRRTEAQESKNLEPSSQQADTSKVQSARTPNPGMIESQTILTVLTSSFGMVCRQLFMTWANDGDLSQQIQCAQARLRGGGDDDFDHDDTDDEDPDRDAKIREIAEIIRRLNIGARRKRGSAMPSIKCVANGSRTTTPLAQDNPDLDGTNEEKDTAQQEESKKSGTQPADEQHSEPQQAETQEGEVQQREPAQDVDPEEDAESDHSSNYSEPDSFYGWSPVRSNDAHEEVDYAESAEQGQIQQASTPPSEYSPSPDRSNPR